MRFSEALQERVFFTFFRLSTVIGLSILVLVLVLLVVRGHSAFSWHFITAIWQNGDISKGGILSPILGSIYLGLGVMIISFPLGIGTAIYITEYTSQKQWKKIIQLAIRNLAGVPSIVYGLFGLAVFVQYLNFGTSLLSAVWTLSIMTLPWVITASIEALSVVPIIFRESSMALGATRWQTIRKIVLPAALPGCLTGGVIGLARALGETAPIILVGATFYLSKLPASPLDKFMALPYHTFILATQHSSPYAATYAAGTALVLIVLTFILSLVAIIIRHRYHRRKDW